MKDFISWLRQKKEAKIFALAGIILCIGYYLLELANGRAQMADFRVYYDAAYALINDTQLYGKAFGVSSGFYKYSPFAALVFTPLALLPYGLASLIYFILIATAVVTASLLFVHFLIRNSGYQNQESTSKLIWVLVLTSVFMADHIERELHLGNVNLFLLLMAFVCFRLMDRKPLMSGLVFAFILLFKPHFLILLPYLIWKKKWKTLAGAAIGLVAGWLLPAIFIGWKDNLGLHSEWLMAMRDHNVVLHESPNTLYGIVNHFLINHAGSNMLVLMTLLVVGVLFFLFMQRNKTVLGPKKNLFIEFFILIALIPNLTHTDTEHFMWTWPLVTFIFFHIVHKNVRKRLLSAVLMALAFVPYCLNSPDIVGKKLQMLFDEGGLLGIANLVIIAVVLLVEISSQAQLKKLNSLQ